MKQLLNNIQTRLKTEIPTLFVDEDWGQLDYFMPAAPVKYPCALIHVGNIRYQTLGHKLQHGVATVVITVADVKFTNTSSNAPLLQKQQAWKVYDTILAVYQALQDGHRPPHRPLVRSPAHKWCVEKTMTALAFSTSISKPPLGTTVPCSLATSKNLSL